MVVERVAYVSIGYKGFYLLTVKGKGYCVGESRLDKLPQEPIYQIATCYCREFLLQNDRIASYYNSEFSNTVMPENMSLVRQLFAGIADGNPALFVVTSGGLRVWDPVNYHKRLILRKLKGYESDYKAIIYNFSTSQRCKYRVLLTDDNEALMEFPSKQYKLDNIRYVARYANDDFFCIDLSGELFLATEQGISAISDVSL